jgi:glyoxylase I family protein
MSIPIHGMAPLIQVFDMPAALAFYHDILGFEVVQRAPASGEHIDWVLLRQGEVELMLNTMYEADSRPDSVDPVRVAAHADTTLYIGCPDVDGAYRELKRLGADASTPVVQPYGMKQCYVTDPDGYVVCFQWSVSS